MREARPALFILIMLMAATVFAQPPGMQGPPGGPMRERIREKVKTMKVWRLTEAVGLTPEQSEKFFPIYNKHQDAIEALEMKRNEITDKLGKLANDPNSSNEEIVESVKQLMDLGKQSMMEREKLVNDISGVLDERQMAKWLVFEERFKQRMQEIIQDIRRDFKGGGMRNRDD